MRPGGRGRRTGEDRQRAQRRERPNRPHAGPIGRTRPRAGLIALLQASATAAIRMSIDSAKWAITNPGARCSRTVKPPSTACATTPRGSAAASNARSRRNGRRVNASTAATTVITPTSPDSARLPNSISACVDSGGSALPSALRPVRTPEPGAGQPDRCARQHDQASAPRASIRDAAVLGGGDGETGAHTDGERTQRRECSAEHAVRPHRVLRESGP